MAKKDATTDRLSSTSTAADSRVFGRRAARYQTTAELFLLTGAMILPSVVTYIYFVQLRDRASAWQQAAYVVGKTAQFVLPIVGWWWLGRSHPSADQPVSPDTNQKCWRLASLFGLFAFGLIASGYYFWIRHLPVSQVLTQQVQDKVLGLGMATPARYLALSLFYCVIHSFLEEYYWRWFVFDRLSVYVPAVAANLISSLGFMCHHVILLGVLFEWRSSWTYLFSVGVAVGGIVWAGLYQRSRRLGPSWFSHFLVDAAILGLGYFLVRPLWG